MSDENNQEFDQSDDLNQEVEQEQTEQVEQEAQGEQAAADDQPTEEPPAKEAGDHITKVINKKHFEAEQAKREAAELRQQLEQMQQQNQPTAPVIPDMPDPFDDNFAEKVKQRDQAIQKRAEYDAKQQQELQQQQMQQQQALQQQQQQLQQSAQTYGERAKKLGVDQAKLQEAANTVAAYNISPELTFTILNDEQGPLITQHLAANPQELAELSTMNPLQQGMYIERNIRTKLTGLKPKKSKTPPPPQDIKGSGVDQDDRYKNIKGAKFE